MTAPFPARTRFYWGYWDARADRAIGRRQRDHRGPRPLPKWDRPYRDGYSAGWYSAQGTTSAELAYTEYRKASSVRGVR